MRRVIDDKYYEQISKEIMDIINKIERPDVSRYSWGIDRSESGLIIKYILGRIKGVKFGRSMNTTGIGNNECYEIICARDKAEEQICGIIHLTNNMYGSTICWVSDYDNNRKTSSRNI